MPAPKTASPSSSSDTEGSAATTALASSLPVKLDSAQGRRALRCSMRSGRSIPLQQLLPSPPSIPHPDAVAKYAGTVAAKQAFPLSALNREMMRYEAESKARIEQYRKELNVKALSLEPELQKKGGKRRLKERERIITKYVSIYQRRREKQAAPKKPPPQQALSPSRRPRRSKPDRPPITPESFAVWPPPSTPARKERGRGVKQPLAPTLPSPALALSPSEPAPSAATHPLATRHAQLKLAYVALLAKLNVQPVTRENLDERIRTAIEHPTSYMKLPEEMLYEKYQLRKAFASILGEQNIAEASPNWRKLKQEKLRESFQFKGPLSPSQQTPQ